MYIEVKVQRIVIRRNDQEVPTKHVILTFGTSVMPTSLEAGYIKINVRPYIPNPRRCFKCQRFGHASHSCRGNATCAKCSATDHSSENCHSSPHCVNCKGDHAAYSRSCPCWKKEKEVIALTVNEKLSYYEARKRLSCLPKRSFSDVARQGVVPQQVQGSTGIATSVPVVAPSTPPEAAASPAATSSKVGPQTPVAQGPRLNRTTRPETRVSAPSTRTSSAPDGAMEVDVKTPASSTPKDQRSLERSKKLTLSASASKKGSAT